MSTYLGIFKQHTHFLVISQMTSYSVGDLIKVMQIARGGMRTKSL